MHLGEILSSYNSQLPKTPLPKVWYWIVLINVGTLAYAGFLVLRVTSKDMFDQPQSNQGVNSVSLPSDWSFVAKYQYSDASDSKIRLYKAPGDALDAIKQVNAKLGLPVSGSNGWVTRRVGQAESKLGFEFTRVVNDVEISVYPGPYLDGYFASQYGKPPTGKVYVVTTTPAPSMVDISMIPTGPALAETTSYKELETRLVQMSALGQEYGEKYKTFLAMTSDNILGTAQGFPPITATVSLVVSASGNSFCIDGYPSKTTATPPASNGRHIIKTMAGTTSKIQPGYCPVGSELS